MPDSSCHLRFVRPREEPPLGLRALTVDLGSLLATEREVGVDAVLLLLTARALALRFGDDVPLDTLGWTLGATRGELLGWLEALERSGLALWTGDASRVELEVVSAETERTLFGPDDEPGVWHRLPTAWFVRTLPLLGRRAFTVYLYLGSRERASGLTAPLTVGGIGRACGLASLRTTRRALRRLTRAGLVAPAGGHGQFVLADPKPLTRWQRRYLSWLAAGALPPTASGRALLLVSVLLPPALVLIYFFLLTR